MFAYLLAWANNSSMVERFLLANDLSNGLLGDKVFLMATIIVL